MFKQRMLLLLTAIAFLALCTFSYANVEQIKKYKEAYPDEKPKCTFCHTDAIPKKDEGKHNWNAYGLKVKETAAKPTAEDYKKVGKAEEFLKKNSK